MTNEERFNKLKDDMVSCYDNGDAMMEYIRDYYIEPMDNLIDIQSDCLTDNYMIGMYNGMVLMRSLIDNKDPKFKETE